MQALYLSSNKLEGRLPAELKTMHSLQIFYIDHNKLTGAMPVETINEMWGLHYFNIADNYITFSDIEPIIEPLKFNHFTYAPQDTVLPLQYNNYKFAVTAGGTISNNIYNWYKDGVLLKTIKGDSTYTAPLSGNYHVEVTNNIATALTLHSDTFAVTLPPLIQDSLILVDLYNSTGGTAWQNKTNWLTKSPLGTWSGVTVNLGTSRVTGVKLNDNRLNGDLPLPIFGLTALAKLDIGHNALTDTLPNAIGSLTNLTLLNISYNKLSGYLPAALGNLVKLDTLNASKNAFTGNIPTTIGSLAELTYFACDSNSLTGNIPAAISNAKSLTVLYLSGNQLSGPLPPSLLSLTKLNTLAIQHNKFTFAGMEGIASKFPFAQYAPQDTVLPLSYSNYTLTVSANSTVSKSTYRWYKNGVLIKTIKSDSTYAPELTGSYSVSISDSAADKLVLYCDTVSVFVPANIRDSLALCEIYKSTNGKNWNDNTNWLSKKPVSTWWGVGTNPVTQTVTFLGPLANNLTGQIPVEIGNLADLQTIDFRYNKLTDTLPASIGNLTSLKSIGLDENMLTGSIPATVGNITTLEVLTITNNAISGSIPASLGNCINLTGINLSYNQLTGPIPATLGKLVNVTSLRLNNNLLTGVIPGELGNMQNLRSLYLTQNKLTGLSAGLGNFPLINNMFIDSNQLTGNIPSQLGKLTYLLKLRLNNNLLSGSIPAQLGNCPELNEIYLNSNNLSGSIPAELGNLDKLAYLMVDHNKLSGALPSSLLNFTYTFVFVLNNNKFTLDGMRDCAKRYSFFIAAPQDTILPIHYRNGVLSVSAGGTLAYNRYSWYKDGQFVGDVYGNSTLKTTGAGRYWVHSQDTAVYLSLFSDTFTIANNIIAPAKPATLAASYEYTAPDGWTHYYYDNKTPNNLTDDTLLLSLKKNGQNIGTIGDGTFAVKLVATVGAGSNTGIKLTSPLITNPTGFYVMNRYWQVTATQQPAASVGVRFYYNNQDLADVNGSYPTHNLTNDKLIFYKAVGGNPDPTSNLAGATKLISIMPGIQPTDTSWVYHKLSDTTQYGEYSVASFSGGGGGGTGNNKALPVTLLNFTGNRSKTDVLLNWQTAQEINAGNYFVERSINGTDFTGIGSVRATGNSAIKQSYSYIDANMAALNTTKLYYRLKITDKDGDFSYSKIISLQNDGITAAYVLYPNPAHTSATVQFTAATVAKYTIAVIAADGKIIKQVNVAATAGVNRAVINVAGLAQGAYKVAITGNNSKQTLTLAKE